MVVNVNEPRGERDRTDESLRTEREESDRAVLASQAAVDDEADMVVLRARDNADAVLGAARDEADRQLARGTPRVATPGAIADARAIEDEVVRSERASADDALRQEREENARILSSLLPLEREKTDRDLLTERARSDHAVSSRDDFLGIVAHDLRNLLGGIVLHASILAQRAATGADPDASLAGTARIQRYAARMNRLIGDLVDIASIDAGKLAVTPTRGDATALIAEAVETFQATAAGKAISLQADASERPLLARFDHDRMFQVLANLITNAIKFTPRGGTVRIRGESSADGVRICVADSGLGIPASMLEAVFQRFWQVDNEHRGLGLGLYISRCIVEAHGGRIWVESKEAEGSRFIVTLPG